MPLIILQIVSTWIFYDRHWDSITKRLTNSVANDIALTIRLMRQYPGPENRTAILEMVAASTNIRIALVDGAILPNEAPARPFGILSKRLSRSMEARVRRPFLIDIDRLNRQVEIKVQLTDGVLIALAPRKRLFSSTTYIFVIWMVGSSMVLFAVAGIFMRNQIRPIRRLASAADAFGKGREVADFKIGGASEVRQAAIAFKRMRDRITRQVQQRTETLAGVSHDLRTPLTRMKLELAMLGDAPGIKDLNDDVVEMERMLEGYLAFARGDGAELQTPTDLTKLLRDVVSGLRRAGASIELDDDGDSIELPLRANAFKRCVNNLVGNGARYGEHVWVRARRLDNIVEIAVDDDGPGIPADRREDVFRPFNRLDQSRNPETGGVGLGLSIALDVAQGHGGNIILEDSPKGGLRALLRVPL
jgi:two-component system osmolarity sensor histidine kinase EnvZ